MRCFIFSFQIFLQYCLSLLLGFTNFLLVIFFLFGVSSWLAVLGSFGVRESLVFEIELLFYWFIDWYLLECRYFELNWVFSAFRCRLLVFYFYFHWFCLSYWIILRILLETFVQLFIAILIFIFTNFLFEIATVFMNLFRFCSTFAMSPSLIIIAKLFLFGNKLWLTSILKLLMWRTIIFLFSFSFG